MGKSKCSYESSEMYFYDLEKTGDIRRSEPNFVGLLHTARETAGPNEILTVDCNEGLAYSDMRSSILLRNVGYYLPVESAQHSGHFEAV